MYFFIIIIFFSLLLLCALIGLYWGGYLGKGKKKVAVVSKQSVSSNLLVDDVDVKDLLHRRETAKVLADYLLDNPNLKHAVGVAVTGTWGTGKSTFLHFLSLALQERNCMDNLRSVDRAKYRYQKGFVSKDRRAIRDE